MADGVLVTSSFLPGRGGIETLLAELCASLSPRLAVLAQATRAGEAIPYDLPYPVVRYPGSMRAPTRGVARAALDAAARHETDKVLFGTPWPLALLGPSLRRQGLRYAAIVHGSEVLVPAAVPGVRSLLARALAEADLLLTVSEFTAGRVRALLQATNRRVPELALLRPKVDVARFSPEASTDALRVRLDIADHDKVLLCFGRLVRRKGVDRLIAALPELRAGTGEVVIVVAGTGPQEARLRKLAAGQEGRVVFTGRVPEDGAAAHYALADVFVLPVVDRLFGLDVEGLGVVLLEAAACGTPVVTGRSGGTPEAVLDGTTGFVIDAHDEARLVDKVSYLLNHPADARRMGRAGRAHVEKEFSGKELPQAFLQWLEGPRTAQ